MAIALGNDISKWQGDPNFETLKNNAQFLIIKTTEGTGFKDPKFARNQTEAHRVGLLLGYYHFARPDLGNSPEAEAKDFLAAIGELREGELLALDYECPNQQQAHITWCRKWLDYVYAQTKVRPFVYLNQSQVTSFNWQEVVDGNYALWIAKYTYDPYNNNFDPSEFKTAAMQQWSNKQQVPGISGNVDGNVFFGSLDTLKKYGKPAAQPAPTPAPEPAKPVTDENAVIHLGVIGEKDYGDVKLKDVRSIIGALRIEINTLKPQVEALNRLRDAVRGLANL